MQVGKGADQGLGSGNPGRREEGEGISQVYLLQGQESWPSPLCNTENLSVLGLDWSADVSFRRGWIWPFRKSHLEPSFLHVLAQLEILVSSGATL